MKWDKGFDYETLYTILLRKINSKLTRPLTRCYLQILLIQLRNGSRISESVRAYKEFLVSKKREVFVKVSKKKRDEYRLMIIPPEVEVEPNSVCYDLLEVDDKTLVNRIKSYASQRLKINTHSLRYSFITYLLKQGVNPAIISKITRHSRLDYILTYTQEKIGEEVLRKMG